MISFCNALLATAVLGACLLQFPPVARAQEHTAYSFCSQTDCTDGESPRAGLIDVGGTLYGTTYFGGSYGKGTVFALDPGTGTETVLYSFCSQGCTDGSYPAAGLIDVDGVLYGTTYAGGGNGAGTVFSFDPGTGTETALYAFCGQANCPDGANPYAALTNVNGTLYGTTNKGGSYQAGTVFSLDPGTGAETVLYSFCSRRNCADGAYPEAGLIDVYGRLFGTTMEGGGTGCSGVGCGTAFLLDPGTLREKVIYAFCSQTSCTDGAFPLAGLIDVKGTLYGTTYGGGNASSGGTVFSLDPGTGTEAVLYAFCSLSGCSDGSAPHAGLIEERGILYGTTGSGGGTQSGGTVFSLDPGTGTETVLYAFCSRGRCRDGKTPTASLLGVGAKLYGTASSSGGSRHPSGGVIFSVRRP